MGVIRPLGVATATDTSTVSFVTIPASSPPQRLFASGTLLDGGWTERGEHKGGEVGEVTGGGIGGRGEGGRRKEGEEGGGGRRGREEEGRRGKRKASE
jgi:hypothetical protein